MLAKKYGNMTHNEKNQSLKLEVVQTLELADKHIKKLLCLYSIYSKAQKKIKHVKWRYGRCKKNLSSGNEELNV